LGVEIRTEAPVARIRTTGGRADGVVMDGGEEIDAGVVLSSLDVKQTFVRMVDADAVPEEFRREVERFKFRGSSGKVNLALDALPDFSCLPGPGEHLRGAISFSPSLDYMEQAYDDAKYGRRSRRPYI